MLETLDAELLQDVQAGNPDAFGLLQTQLEPQIRRFVRRLLGSSDAEDDIIQDTFLALYENIDRIQPIENLRPYLFGIARNRCYSELRSQRRFDTVSVDDEPDIEFGTYTPVADDSTPPDEVTHWLLLHLEVQQAMDKLPELQRQVLIMYSEENLSYAEIAQIMNTSIGTVKSRLHYAKRALKSLLRWETVRTLEEEFGF